MATDRECNLNTMNDIMCKHTVNGQYSPVSTKLAFNYLERLWLADGIDVCLLFQAL